jgi:hypothetical protein
MRLFFLSDFPFLSPSLISSASTRCCCCGVRVSCGQHIKRLPLPELRSAELALYRRRPDQAESILLAAQPTPLVWRAIEMNLNIHRYDRYALFMDIYPVIRSYFLVVSSCLICLSSCIFFLL